MRPEPMKNARKYKKKRTPRPKSKKSELPREIRRRKLEDPAAHDAIVKRYQAPLY